MPHVIIHESREAVAAALRFVSLRFDYRVSTFQNEFQKKEKKKNSQPSQSKCGVVQFRILLRLTALGDFDKPT